MLGTHQTGWAEGEGGTNQGQETRGKRAKCPPTPFSSSEGSGNWVLQVTRGSSIPYHICFSTTPEVAAARLSIPISAMGKPETQ